MRLLGIAFLLTLTACGFENERHIPMDGQGSDCQVAEECSDRSLNRPSADHRKDEIPDRSADSSVLDPSVESLVCSAKKLRFSPNARLLAIFSSVQRGQEAYNKLYVLDIECAASGALSSCVIGQGYMQDGPEFFPAMYWSVDGAFLYVADHRGLGWINVSPSFSAPSRDFVTKVGKPGIISLKGRHYFQATGASSPEIEFDSLKVDLTPYPEGSNDRRAFESGGALLLDLIDRYAFPDDSISRIVDDSKQSIVGTFGYQGVSLESDSISSFLLSRLDEIERERMLVRGLVLHSATGRYALLAVDRHQTKHFSVGEDDKLLIDVECGS